MIKKQNIVLDFDNTQFNTFPVLARYINNVFGIESLPQDYVLSSIEQVLIRYGVKTPYTINEIYYYFIQNFQLNSVLQMEIEPMLGLIDVLPQLADRYNLYTATARQKVAAQNLYHLYEKYGISKFITDIHFVNERNPISCKSIAKSDFIRCLSGETIAFIDDSQLEVEMMGKIVPTYLYGQDFTDWYHIADHFIPGFI